jgi:hypothetical protein
MNGTCCSVVDNTLRYKPECSSSIYLIPPATLGVGFTNPLTEMNQEIEMKHLKASDLTDWLPGYRSRGTGFDFRRYKIF